MFRALHERSLALVAPSLALACVFASCGGRENEPPARARRVILITCDTLRADHLGCYGHARDTTPNIDAFAREAVRYEEAYSCAPMTVPSLSALLTGRMPQEIGAAANNRQLMGAEALTMAEVFRGAGIATAAFVSNGVLRRPPAAQSSLGVGQGFQKFDDDKPPSVSAFTLARPPPSPANALAGLLNMFWPVKVWLA